MAGFAGFARPHDGLGQRGLRAAAAGDSPGAGSGGRGCMVQFMVQFLDWARVQQYGGSSAFGVGFQRRFGSGLMFMARDPCRGVAKLVKAPDFDSGMRGFESFLPCQNSRSMLRECSRQAPSATATDQV